MSVTVTYEVYVMTTNGLWSLVEELPQDGEKRALAIAKKIETDQRYPTKIILNAFNERTKKNKESLVYITEEVRHAANNETIGKLRQNHWTGERRSTLMPALEEKATGIKNVKQAVSRLIIVILIALFSAFVLSSITMVIASYFGVTVDTHDVSLMSLTVFLITFVMTVLPLLVYFVPWNNLSFGQSGTTNISDDDNDDDDFYIPHASYTRLKNFFDWIFADPNITSKYNEMTSTRGVTRPLPKTDAALLVKKTDTTNRRNPLLDEKQGVPSASDNVTPFDAASFFDKEEPSLDLTGINQPPEFSSIAEDVGVSKAAPPKEASLNMENVMEIGDFANTVIAQIRKRHSKINNHGKTGLHLMIAGACEKMCELMNITTPDKLKWLVTKCIEMLGANNSLASTFANNLETYHYDKDYRYMIDIGSDAFLRLRQKRNDAFLKIPDAFSEWTELEMKKMLKESPVQKSNAIITIMFTDIVGSTRATQVLGDTVAQNMIREHNRIVRIALKNHFGKEVKHTGDGIMASFMSAYQAVGAEIDIQRNVLDYNLKSETGTFPMMLRIGINSGEPIIEDGDFFGATVQIAARICSETKPNQILVSSVVKELSEGKKFHFNDIGMVELRGIQEKKQLFEVVWNKM